MMKGDEKAFEQWFWHKATPDEIKQYYESKEKELLVNALCESHGILAEMKKTFGGIRK